MSNKPHPFVQAWAGRRNTPSIKHKDSKESDWTLDTLNGRPIKSPLREMFIEETMAGDSVRTQECDEHPGAAEDGMNRGHRTEEEKEDPVAKSFWDPNLSFETQQPFHNDQPNIKSANIRPHDDDEDDSPYPEVRTSVHPTDDPSLPVSTFRSWFLGILMSILLPGVNQFFIYRYPNVLVPGIVAQLIVHPLGLGLAKLPRKGYWRVINPCEWNAKEHTLIYIMANVSAGSAYATDIIAAQRFFYDQRWGWGYNFLLVTSTQMLGFSFAGILHRILVTPASMIWPATLVNTALFNTLHASSGPQGGQIKSRTRQVFFYVNAGLMFGWSFFPSYLFTALSNFDWVTWIKPTSQVINLLFGYQTGAGMSILTFDWGMMAAVNNPLATPWWVIGNVLGGFLFFIWFLGPILYYSNIFYAKYLPFSSARVFDNTASTYNVTKIVREDATLDVAAYDGYSPVYMTVTSALSYGMNFAAITSTVVHSFLFFRHQVWHHLLHPPSRADVHARLASKYPSVPGWWCLTILIVNLSLGIATVQAWPTQLPVWALMIAIALAGVMVLPIGLLQAITNMQVGLNVISEIVIGAMIPGKPVAMMIFKTYGYITTTQALGFVQDLKVAHYMHLPPRHVFFAQIVACVIGSVTQLSVQTWLFNNVPDICSLESDKWWCPSTRTFFSASVLYGLIGPKRLFGPGSLYKHLNWFYLLGAIMPLVTWLMARRWPKVGWQYICWPVVFSCVSLLPPYLPINFISFCIVGWITQYYIRRKYFHWWSRYNYTLSAAWTCGYALCVIIIFFTLQLPKSGHIGERIQKWWGNTVYSNTLDGQGGVAAAALRLKEGETFGLKDGSWVK
ncbi:OPT family small oligopeptide transporter [Kwoniella shivajii]|uniref:OPT family small oligopeptide transporter n=1 Tax=Kwoniella shivajii TaxID=564305 RepID=A0ABZ1D9K3_9TREE|nr:OPT family small oligopeptide transporter [Kwoniella shivajii]